jgi:hypothetical protein
MTEDFLLLPPLGYKSFNISYVGSYVPGSYIVVAIIYFMTKKNHTFFTEFGTPCFTFYCFTAYFNRNKASKLKKPNRKLVEVHKNISDFGFSTESASSFVYFADFGRLKMIPIFIFCALKQNGDSASTTLHQTGNFGSWRRAERSWFLL